MSKLARSMRRKRAAQKNEMTLMVGGPWDGQRFPRLQDADRICNDLWTGFYQADPGVRRAHWKEASA